MPAFPAWTHEVPEAHFRAARQLEPIAEKERTLLSNNLPGQETVGHAARNRCRRHDLEPTSFVRNASNLLYRRTVVVRLEYFHDLALESGGNGINASKAILPLCPSHCWLGPDVPWLRPAGRGVQAPDQGMTASAGAGRDGPRMMRLHLWSVKTILADDPGCLTGPEPGARLGALPRSTGPSCRDEVSPVPARDAIRRRILSRVRSKARPDLFSVPDGERTWPQVLQEARSPWNSACAPSSPTATLASAHSLGRRGARSRRRSISPPPRRCTARWTCGSGWKRERRSLTQLSH